ncbi:hypothetical protein A3A68_01505 [Candidatus Saccharibacteria bacterium RIFCSPLOWO2_01_FULL_48_13]|nr:MAG: hypothetical protein A2884_02525 [Candidatus Saccharibacteria bacterium RIFCSPHIGHO2_01_FULL_48_12]OGL37425.1 MAG: hypothetical protein A3A68_01505 [Candidatus Saccharibacteria bacterium RIFCSPLOWO2_01_FULL_48_13]
MNDFERNSSDKIEQPAQPETITRLAVIVMAKAEEFGERIDVGYPNDVSDPCYYLEMAGADMDKDLANLDLYYYLQRDESEDMFCKIVTESTLSDSETQRTIFSFIGTDQTQLCVYKTTQVIDHNLIKDQADRWLKGDLADRHDVEQELIGEQRASVEAFHFAHEAGLTAVTETELQRLEELISSARVL